jgi:hypothetical protein
MCCVRLFSNAIQITSIGMKGFIALKADKGDAIVILTQKQFQNNMDTMLEEGPIMN